MSWFDNWTRAQRLVITVPSGTVAPLPYFPVVLTAASLPTELTNNTYGRSDGGDLTFAADLGVGNSVSSIGARIPCEVVSAAFGGSPSAEIHVQVPSVAATGTLTYIWVLYGNSAQVAQPAASSTYGSQKVWLENGVQNFQSVWHFGTPSTLSLVDSTSAGIVLTNVGTATNGAGNFGGAVSLNGTSQWLICSYAAIVQPITISSCLKHIGDCSNNPYVFDGGASGNRTAIGYNLTSSTTLDIYAGAAVAGHSSYTGAWEQVGGVFNGTSSYLYRSGIADLSNVNPSTYGNSGVTIGDRYNGQGGGNWFGGFIEEFRISTVIRSASWFASEWANWNAPSTFIAPPSGQGPLGVSPYAYSATGMAISGDCGSTGSTLFAPLGGLLISGSQAGATAGPSPGAAGLAISGGYGGTTAGPSPGVAGLAISGGYGGTTAGPSPGVAGLAISGAYGGTGATLLAALGGLAISGGPGGTALTVAALLAGLGISGSPAGMTSCPPSYIFSAAGLEISGDLGGTAATVTVSAAGLGISGAPGGATGGEFLGPLYLPYEYTSVPIEAGNTNPFGIDPERTTVITVGLTSSD